MNDFLYLKFNDPKGNQDQHPVSGSRTIQKVIVRILSLLIPKANPDFEGLLDSVAYWKIEFSINENPAWR